MIGVSVGIAEGLLVGVCDGSFDGNKLGHIGVIEGVTVGCDGASLGTILGLLGATERVGSREGDLVGVCVGKNEIDGINDVFKIAGIGYVTDDFELKIYDRLGELVFKTNDITKGWDGSVKGGKIAATNVYVYKIEIKEVNMNLKT